MWPKVREVQKRRRTDSELPPEHLAVLTALFRGYSGIANVNYKVRDEEAHNDETSPTGHVEGAPGQMAIFECNPRVGGDFANDVPRDLARQMLERLEGLKV